MSADVTTDLYCDWCLPMAGPTADKGHFIKHPGDARSARRRAFAHGWVRIFGDDVCPLHDLVDGGASR